MSELNPCRFCGSDLVSLHTIVYSWVQCDHIKCGARTGEFPSEKEAVASWNTRPPTTIKTAAEEMAKAISRHRYDIWGDGGEVYHKADVELYAALRRYEQAKEGK